MTLSVVTGSFYPQPSYGSPRGQQWPRDLDGRQAPVGLGIASAVLAVVLTVIEVGTALASISAQDEFADALREGRGPYDVLTLYDGLELLLFPAMVVAYVVSCLWLQAARKNTTFLSPQSHQRSAVWVWLGWWVPIVSLWFPYQVVRDVRDGSERGRQPIGLGLWWTAWIVYLVGNRVTANVATSTDPDVVAQLSLFEGVTAVAVVVGCVQWCRIVQRITSEQERTINQR